MAKFIADIDFRGFKEEKDFKKGDEFEMNVERSKEIETTIFKNFPHIKKVMTRIDNKDETDEPDKTEKTKSSKKE